jgi:hypothetical protein
MVTRCCSRGVATRCPRSRSSSRSSSATRPRCARTGHLESHRSAPERCSKAGIVTKLRTKLGAPHEGGAGGGRNAVAGGLLKHRLWPRLKPLLKAPWHTDALLDFLERLFGPFVQVIDF